MGRGVGGKTRELGERLGAGGGEGAGGNHLV